MCSKISKTTLAIEQRVYQKHAKELMFKNYKKGDRTFHIIAPPGSGKTVLGLDLALTLGKKTLILSPSKAISTQWIDRFKEFATVPEEIDYKVENLISDSIDHNPEILSITYQAFSVKGKSGKLHKNVDKVVNYLIDQKFQTIIVDESHHLINYWAEVIKKFLKKADYEIVLIALTATPPIDKKGKEKLLYLELVEEIDYEIPIPAVVKNGNLAPYQDLIYFITPSEEEIGVVEDGKNIILKLIDEIDKLSKDGKIDLSLGEWIDLFIKNPTFNEESLTFYQLYFKNPQLAISLVKYLKNKNLDLPIEIIVKDEMEEKIDLFDYATLFINYIDNFLAEKNTPFYNDIITKIVKKFKKVGYGLTQKGVTTLQKSMFDKLSISLSKIEGVKYLVEKSYEIDQEQFFGLILVDYIDNTKRKKRVNGVSTFKAFTNFELYNRLKPVMVSGKKLLFHKDLKKNIDKIIEQHNIKPFENLDLIDNSYYISNSIKSTSDLLFMITELTYKGETHLIIGTRSLIGEGYDNVKLNTLFDLTATTSFVSVNQMRGRVLRKDPDIFDKTANIWDIVTILPEIEGGDYDFKRVKNKHKQFYSINKEGEIERGSDILNFDIKNRDIEILNNENIERSQKKGDLYNLWRVGESYKDIKYDCFNLNLDQEIVKNIVPKDLKKRKVQDQERYLNSSIFFKIDQKRKNKILQNRFFWGLLIIGFLGGVTSSLLISGKTGVIFIITSLFFLLLRSNLKFEIIYLLETILIMIFAMVGILLVYKERTNFINYVIYFYPPFLLINIIYFKYFINLIKNLYSNISIDNFIKGVLKVIFYSCVDNGVIDKGVKFNDIKVVKNGGNLSIYSENRDISELMVKSLTQFFEPIYYQKYVISYKKVDKNSEKLLGYFPIPSICSKNRDYAEVFKKYWNDYIAKGELLYIKNGKNIEKIERYIVNRAISVKTEHKKYWV